MLKKLNLLLAMLVMVLVMAACGGGAQPTNESENENGNGNEDTSAAEEQTDSIVIGFSQVTMESPFYISLVEGAEAEAEKLGVELVVVDAQNNIEKQNSDVSSLITRGIDVLLLNPTNPSAVTPSIRAAGEAGVPIITIDRSVQQEVASHIGRDNEEMGRLAGKKAVEILGGEGQATGKIIEIQGDAGGTVMQARHGGFHEIVSQEPGITVIEGPYSDYIRANAVSAMQDLIQAHPDVNLVYAHNDDMALGAIQVLKQVNLSDSVKIVGIDGLMEAIKQITEGNFHATVLNDPMKLGALAVQTAIKVANGETVESYIDGGTGLIDETNAADYLDENFDFAVTK